MLSASPYAPVARPRLSRLAVAALATALLPAVPVGALAVLGVLAPVPGAGLLLGMLLCVPLSLLAVVIQSVAWGLATAGLKRAHDEGLRGAALCWTARAIAGFQGVLCCLLIGLCVLLPTLLLAAEAAAWRAVAARGVAAAEATVAEVTALRSGVVDELAAMSAHLEKLATSGETIAQEVKALNDNTAAMSGSLADLARESAAWREEVGLLRDFDPWHWLIGTLDRGWTSFLEDTGLAEAATPTPSG